MAERRDRESARAAMVFFLKGLAGLRRVTIEKHPWAPDHDRTDERSERIRVVVSKWVHAIRDLKEGAGLEHMPSGHFSANSAWLQCAVLAHNLIRWTATLGQPGPVDRLTMARTLRVRLIGVPGRLVNRAGTMRAPAGWPWPTWFAGQLERLRALQPASG